MDTYTDPTFRSVSSPEIGYGISSANAIKTGLRARRLPVVECAPSAPSVAGHKSKLNWLYRSYERLNSLAPQANDLVFAFHSLIHFPGELRRLINHHTRVGCPLIGYTHGSHWDPTDSIRSTSNPGLLYQDLANLLTYDRLLLVSDYYRRLLRSSLSSLGPLVTERFDFAARVVGLPIDTDTIDSCATDRQAMGFDKPVRILFNHALRPPKQPEIALSVIERVLTSTSNCSVDVTRSVDVNSPLGLAVDQLSNRFKGRIRCHGTLSLESYYRLLWQTDIQFSTASHESLGVATLEAMHTGNACFTPNRLSYPEVTRGLGTYRDIDDLVSLMVKAASDAAFRKSISVSQMVCAAEYSPTAIAARLHNVIDELPP